MRKPDNRVRVGFAIVRFLVVVGVWWRYSVSGILCKFGGAPRRGCRTLFRWRELGVIGRRNSGGYVFSVAVTFKGDTLGELRIVLKYPGGRLGGSMCIANCGGVYEAVNRSGIMG